MRLLISRRGVIAAVLGVALAAWFIPQLASAHANLVASRPAADSTVATAPASVTLYLSGAVQPTGNSIVVTGPGGARVDMGDGAPKPDPERQTMVATLQTGLGPGTYTVNFVTLSIDGATVTGSFKFSIGPVTTPTPTPTPAPAGGQGFNLAVGSGPSINLSWRDGTQEDNYLLARLVPSPVQLFTLAQNATSYTDTAVANGGLYCYLLIPRVGQNGLGLTNMLCAVVGTSTVGDVAPPLSQDEAMALVREALAAQPS